MDDADKMDRDDFNPEVDLPPSQPNRSWLPMAIGVGALMAVLATLLTVL